MSENIKIYIGLDDTDHVDIGCTTEKLNHLLLYLELNINFEIVSRRLVRLWPFASRRTRGNAALSAVILLDKNDENKLYNLCNKWFNKLLSEISNHPLCIHPASPALIISKTQFPNEIYWETVRGHVKLSSRLLQIKNYNCKIFSSNSQWGIIGASAALAWSPEQNSSYELISWRKKSMIGKKRLINLETVIELDNKYPQTFLNRDPTKNRGLIAPRTPCPVLYGIRSSSPEILEDSHKWLQSKQDVEKSSDYAIHCTNQLSDDHVTPYYGTVLCKPTTSKGAHSSIKVFVNGKIRTLLAFSQGDSVNRLLRLLEPGDIISWTGLLSPSDSSIHLEKLSILEPVPRIYTRPTCCGSSMKSAGISQKLRCSGCGKNCEKYWLGKMPNFSEIYMINNWTEPNPSNRRHLSKPLDLGVPILNNLIP